MSRFYLFHVSTLIGGTLLGIPALVSAIAGEQSISLVLQSVGGCCMAIAALYGVLTKDPTEFTVGKYTVWSIVLATLLLVLSYVIRFVN